MSMGAPPVPALASRAEFLVAVTWGLRSAMERGARHLLWVDHDFDDWPLDDPALLQMLTEWLHRPQRRLVLLARDWRSMPLRHARFCAWRRHYTHALDTRTPDVDDLPTLPTLLLDDTGVCVRLNDRVHWRGRCSVDAPETRLLFGEFDVLAQRSAPDFPVNQAGL